MPECRTEIEELQTEAKYYLVQGLVDQCQAALQVRLSLTDVASFAFSKPSDVIDDVCVFYHGSFVPNIVIMAPPHTYFILSLFKVCF